MDVQGLAYFISAYRSGSLSKAAAEHFMTQQALSKNITKLESELGVPLFERTRKGIEPNEAGTVFYGYANKIAALADEARRRTREAAGIERATLTVGIMQATTYQLMPQAVARFSALHPDVELRFVDYVDSLEMYRDVIANKIQAAPTGGNHRVRQQGVYFITAGFESPYCSIDARSPLAGKDSIELSDLRGSGVQLPATGMMHWLDTLKQHIKEHEPDITIAETTSGSAGMLQAMHADYTAFGPRSFCFPLQGKTYVPFDPPEGMDPLISIDIAVHAPDDPLVKSFCDAVTASMSQSISASGSALP